MMGAENDDDFCDLADTAIGGAFDLSTAKVQEFVSKDRKTATIRMTDAAGLCDMKIYLLLAAKKHQMELLLGVFEEHSEEH